MLNLTQHSPTPEQSDAGVDPRNARIAGLLTIEKEVLLAAPSVRHGIYDSRVRAIVAEIWPRLMEANAGRTLRAAEAMKEGRRMDAWNISREPVAEAMVGGAPYLVDRLKERLKELGVRPVYALTERESVEEVVGGEVRKTVVFRHLGFEEA